MRSVRGQSEQRDVLFIPHPDVVVDPAVPVPRWALSQRGRERMQAFAARIRSVGSVFSSTEQKAIDGASILAARLGVIPGAVAELGENDRSATGYLPQGDFEATATEFLRKPDESVRGWERAIDAQARIVTAVRRILSSPLPVGKVAIVSHGGVGALLLCHLRGGGISRTHEQPGRAGGNYFRFRHDSWSLVHGWVPIDDHGLAVRQATLADVPALDELIAAASRALGRPDYTDAQIEAWSMMSWPSRTARAASL
jgi:broad specificity phosphatase PhoE